MSTTATAPEPSVKEGSLALIGSKSDGPDSGAKTPDELYVEDSVSFEDAKGFLDLHNENSFESHQSDETERYRLKPVFNWGNEAELADAQEKKSPTMDKADDARDGRDAQKREAYEAFVASMNVMSDFRIQARKKLNEYQLTKEEKRDMMAQLLLDEGSRSLAKEPVVKFDENFVLDDRSAIGKGEQIADPIREDRRSVEPMSANIEGKIDKLTSKAQAEGIAPKKKAGTTRTSDRVDGNTFLGHVFGQLGRDGSSGDDDDSSDDGGSDGDVGGPKRSQPWAPHQLSRQAEEDPETEPAAKKKRGRYGAIKPTPPEKYSGEADVQKYFKFVAQSVAYCQKGEIPPEDQIQEISYFLTEEAYKFYLNEVSMEEYKWDLTKFVKRLFDYCFPPNYRLKEQQKLEQFKQGNLRVRPYAAELKNKYQIIGYAHKREKVRKLWSGLQPRLQQKLFENGFDPERSKWGQVVDAAEMYEIAREMGLGGDGQRKDNRTREGNRPQRGGKIGPKTHEAGIPPERAKNPDPERERQRTGNNRHVPRKPERKGGAQRQNRLSEADKARYRKEGKCFNCGETGHVSNRCPDNDRVKTSGSGPPGIRSNKISFDLEETEAMGRSGDPETNGVHIHAAAIRFADIRVRRTPSGRKHWRRVKNEDANRTGPRGISSEEYQRRGGLGKSRKKGLRDLGKRRKSAEGRRGPEEPSVNGSIWTSLIQKTHLQRVDLRLDNPHLGEKIEDPYVARAEYVLESQKPYPGDDATRVAKGKRFLVYRTSESKYVIYDLESPGDGELVEDTLVLADHCLLARYYAKLLANQRGIDISRSPRWLKGAPSGPLKEDQIAFILEKGYSKYRAGARNKKLSRFRVTSIWNGSEEVYSIEDKLLCCRTNIQGSLVGRNGFDLREWYCKRVEREIRKIMAGNACIWRERAGLDYDNFISTNLEEGRRNTSPEAFHDVISQILDGIGKWRAGPCKDKPSIHVLAIRPDKKKDNESRNVVERNRSVPKDPSRMIPDPVVVEIKIDGHPIRALIDSGSLGDFVSTTVAGQLNLKRRELSAPLNVQLAAPGSRSKINYGVVARMQYQMIDEERNFDVMNLSGYDAILGTPWIFQHKVLVGLNPARVVIGSADSLEMRGSGVQKLASRTMKIYEDRLEDVRQSLIEYARPICRKAADVPLPPMRAINHEIPLIDEDKVYRWRPSRCPEALLPQWTEKMTSYIKTGRWEVTSGKTTAPILCIPKPGNPPRLRVVVDLRDRNANTRKMSSPLPDMEGILRRAARGRFRSLIDGQDAYEQIRVIPEHVHRTAVNTPSGTMVSHVVQQGDCNAPATYQALMNHLFAEFIGRWMDVYLDDIVIYSATLEDHIRHIKLVIDILKREKLYLSEQKLKLLEPELKILGRIVDGEGIRMDPEKVDALVRWKVPTNRDLLRGFLGAAGYLADDIDRVRVPLGILHGLTSDNVPFRWTYTHLRAFEEVKTLAMVCKTHHRVPLQYGPGAPPVNVVTDGCLTGIGGLVSQGSDWKTAKVAAFYSAKLSPTQQHYPTHEVELLAGVETMLRHRDILQGVPFRWFTDHKGLIHLLKQKEMSARQIRWLEKIAIFEFEVVYVPGAENILTDALSRLYSNEHPGTTRAPSEYAIYDDADVQDLVRRQAGVPVLTGLEGEAGVVTIHAVTRRMARETVGEEALRRSRRIADRALRSERGLEGGNGEEEHANKDENEPTNKDEAPVHSHKEAPNQGPDDEKLEIDSDQAQLDISRLMSNIDIRDGIKNKYSNDPLFAKICNDPSAHRNFERDDKEGLIYLKEGKQKMLCIPNIEIKGRNVREIIIGDAHSLLAHLGPRKTYDYLRSLVWWKTMAADIQRYCESCVTCQRSKSTTQRPYGLLNPLDIPSRPWESIGIDFVGPLPESRDRNGRYDQITTIIDRHSGMVHLIPSRGNFKAKDIAEMIFAEVYKHHGLPRTIISDRDKWFTSKFWKRLNELIGTKLNMSSAYHPQSDGATERANRTIGQMLRACVADTQGDWVQRLPGIEFAINNARSESTGFAPFFLNSGRMPRSFVWNSDEPMEQEYAGVREFAERLKMAVVTAHDHIIGARVKQVRDANRKRRDAPFEEGDYVYLSTKNLAIGKGLARKLFPKYIGPYRVTEALGNETFRIRIPFSLKRRGIDDSFHASLLRIHHANDDRLFPGRTETQLFNLEDEEKEWAIDKILTHSGAKQNAKFEILWKSGDKSWMSYHQISTLRPLEEYLEAYGISDIRDLGAGNGTPPEDPQVFLASIRVFACLDPRFDTVEMAPKKGAVPEPEPRLEAMRTDDPVTTSRGNENTPPCAETIVLPPDGLHANGQRFVAPEGDDSCWAGNQYLFRRSRTGDFYYIRGEGELTVEVPEYMMKKWLIWDAMVSIIGITEASRATYANQVRVRNRSGPLGIIVNDIDPDRNVPAGFEDWARAMNRDQSCPWSVVTYNQRTRVWEWPAEHYPRSRGPHEIVVDMPTDAEIKNLVIVLDSFKDRFGNFSVEVLERHKTAFQELMLAERASPRRGSPYARGSRPHSRAGHFGNTPSPRASTPMTPLSGGMLGLQM